MPYAQRPCSLGFALLACASLGTSLAHAQTEADLMVEVVIAAQVDPGADVSIDVTVTNNGPDDAVDVVLADSIPAGLTFVSMTASGTWLCSAPAVGMAGAITCTEPLLAAAATATFHLVLHADAAAAAGTYFTNVFAATSATFDPTDENSAAPATTQTPPPPPADLFVTLEGPRGSNADTDITYLVGVSNGGGQDATTVVLQQSIPGDMVYGSIVQTSGPSFACTFVLQQITCTAATLAAGASASFTVVGHIPAATVDGATYQTQVTVTSDYDPNAENDQMPSLVCVQANGCNAGLCNAMVAVVCPLPDQCHDQAVCDPLDGTCPPLAKLNGTGCDDASVCTQTDTCIAGVCTGDNPLMCSDDDACTTDACDPVMGCFSVGGCDAGDGDAGSIVDAGGAAVDAGGEPTPNGGSGCSCSVTGRADARRNGAWMTIGLIALLVARRRRSR